MRTKLGILGGTFNPIHIGHLLLAEQAREEFSLDHVMFMPSGCSYMKQESGAGESAERLRMVELAIRERSDFSCSDLEICRGGYTYTCDTLRCLNEKYPKADLHFIMGADSLFTIEKWRHPEEIFARCTLIAAARSGADPARMEHKRSELEERFHGRIRLLNFPDMEISSSDIRERVRSGRSIRYLVPEAVRSFIEETNLYALKEKSGRKE